MQCIMEQPVTVYRSTLAHVFTCSDIQDMGDIPCSCSCDAGVKMHVYAHMLQAIEALATWLRTEHTDNLVVIGTTVSSKWHSEVNLDNLHQLHLSR